MKQASDIIIRPVISEKSMKEAQLGRYTFLVDRTAMKPEIKVTIEKLFNVKVTKVFTSITKGSRTKQLRQGRKKTSFIIKKARVKLQKGQKIDIFDEKTDEKKT